MLVGQRYFVDDNDDVITVQWYVGMFEGPRDYNVFVWRNDRIVKEHLDVSREEIAEILSQWTHNVRAVA